MKRESLHIGPRQLSVVCICGHSQSEHNFLGDECCRNIARVDNLFIPCLCDKFFPL